MDGCNLPIQLSDAPQPRYALGGTHKTFKSVSLSTVQICSKSLLSVDSTATAYASNVQETQYTRIMVCEMRIIVCFLCMD